MRWKFCPRDISRLIEKFATIDRVDYPLWLNVFSARDNTSGEFASIANFMGYTGVGLGVRGRSGRGVCRESRDVEGEEEEG